MKNERNFVFFMVLSCCMACQERTDITWQVHCGPTRQERCCLACQVH